MTRLPGTQASFTVVFATPFEFVVDFASRILSPVLARDFHVHFTGCPAIGLPAASSTVAFTVMLTLHLSFPAGRYTVTLPAASPA